MAPGAALRGLAPGSGQRFGAAEFSSIATGWRANSLRAAATARLPALPDALPPPAVIGHVDSGKSTTTGHLIYKCGGVSPALRAQKPRTHDARR